MIVVIGARNNRIRSDNEIDGPILEAGGKKKLDTAEKLEKL